MGEVYQSAQNPQLFILDFSAGGYHNLLSGKDQGVYAKMIVEWILSRAQQQDGTLEGGTR
jgi:hypothetical protein